MIKDEDNNTLLTLVNESLEKTDNEAVVKLQEHIFAGVFMPVFAGEENKYGATLATWVNFAGSPYKEVDVIDSRGTVLFRVPPIYDRSTIDSSAKHNLHISHIVTTAQQYSGIHPNQGKAYLDGALSKCAMLLKTPVNITKNLEFWNMVFKRYGREEIIVDTKEEQITLDKTSDDDFEGF